MGPYSTSLRAVAAAGLGLPLAFAPSTTKYRIDQSLTQEVDATAAGGAKQRIAFSTSSFVMVSLSDTCHRLLFHFGYRLSILSVP